MMSNPAHQVQPWPAVTLLVASPLIGEFLLGNMAIDMLWMLPLLCLLYGTGALLVREFARRLGSGWPGILMLGLAYGIIEESFVTQSLFDRNFLGLRLLDYGYLPAAGIGAWWSVFVLALHAIWSTGAAINLSEALWPKHAGSLWLSSRGLAATMLAFALGCIGVAFASGARAAASVAQLSAAAAIVILLCAATWFLGRRRARVARAARRAPSAVTAGISAFTLLSLFMLTTWTMHSVSAIVNVGAMVGLLLALALLIHYWSHAAGWSPLHRLALTGGALLTYGWWSLLLPAMVTTSTPMVDTMGNMLFLGGALASIVLAWRRTVRGFRSSSVD
ncbi:hypothetical protein [Allosphingosinicella deserti]|uniref:Uncharacterized protein n=1 Tax=Allosphingosinicella deserti TaxID=2116704 RepID=A0A2P7QIT6_9SPHN|nr:hypothetical protein [Sphingomonas deserti]PSJ37884.1 hypothetical protein C7I55_19425 [Sphingomonas deserti]